jgi:hypothetical protein
LELASSNKTNKNKIKNKHFTWGLLSFKINMYRHTVLLTLALVTWGNGTMRYGLITFSFVLIKREQIRIAIFWCTLESTVVWNI